MSSYEFHPLSDFCSLSSLITEIQHEMHLLVQISEPGPYDQVGVKDYAPEPAVQAYL